MKDTKTKKSITIDLSKLSVNDLMPPPDILAVPPDIEEEAKKNGNHLCWINKETYYDAVKRGYVKAEGKDGIIETTELILMKIPEVKFREQQMNNLIRDAMNRNSVEFKPV